MDKYIYAECSQDYWPTIKSLQVRSYNEAVEHLISDYFVKFDDDKILNIEDFDDLREYLNDKYSIAISDLIILEEL